MVAGEQGLHLKQQEKQTTIKALAKWVKEQTHSLAPPALHAPLNWEPLGGDAGFRHYFRLPQNITLNESRLLAVWSPPATEKNREFVRIARFLRQNGIHTPEIFAIDKERGFLLVEDLGHTMMLDILTSANVDALYGQAGDILLKMHQCPLDSSVYGEYSKRELLRELHLFPEWFVARLLGYPLSAEERAMLEQTFDALCYSALQQPRTVVHRDFHSRNLVVRPGQELGVIDFQDGVLGPITYDLVSLLRDCYVEWPTERVNGWVEGHWQRLQSNNVLSGIPLSTFMHWFDWMGLQRHIKVLGIFARLYIRDGKEGYLRDLPLVVRYTRFVLSQYPDLAACSRWFDDALMPLIRQQSWMPSR